MLAKLISGMSHIHDTQDVEAFRRFVNAIVVDLEALHGLVKDADDHGRYVHFLKMRWCCDMTLLEYAILQTDGSSQRPFPTIDFTLRTEISASEAGDMLLCWLPSGAHG